MIPARSHRALRLVAALLVVSHLTLAGCRRAEALEPDPREYLSGTVQIGVNTELPGWSLYEHGAWSGFDIDLGNWLGHALGFQPRYVNVTTDQRRTVLVEAEHSQREGRGDQDYKLVIANFSINDERRADIDFAGPYFLDKQAFAVRKGSPIRQLSDLRDKRLCSPSGSTTIVRIGALTIPVLPEKNLSTCMEKLRAGGVDVVSTDKIILEGFIHHDPADDFRLVADLEIGEEQYGIGIPNNRPELCELLTAKLKEFIDDKWNERFRDNFGPVSAEGRRPNSALLDPCEQPTEQ